MAWVGVLVGFGACLTSLHAAPRISDIQYEFVPGERESDTRRMVKKRLVKFNHYIKSPSHEVFYVNWDAGQGLGSGATVIFEYRQGRSAVNRVVKFQYPTAVAGKKRTTFNIPAVDADSGGRVSAWRVRLVHDQKILSSRVSPSWDAR